MCLNRADNIHNRTAFGLYLKDPVLWCTNAFGAVNGVVQVACCLLLPNTDVTSASVTSTAVSAAAVTTAECEPLCCCECGAVQTKPSVNGNSSNSSGSSAVVMHPSSSAATFAVSPTCSEAVVPNDSVCISNSSSELELSTIAAAGSSSIAAYADVPLTPTRAAVAAASADNAV
jgi:hypothetical protein